MDGYAVRFADALTSGICLPVSQRRAAIGNDLIIASGGVPVGEEDHVKPAPTATRHSPPASSSWIT